MNWTGTKTSFVAMASVGADNVGTCEFEVTTPTFQTGMNVVGAVDGDGNRGHQRLGDHMDGDQVFTLKPSITASPAGGSPGEVIQVQLASFTGWQDHHRSATFRRLYLR